MDDKTQPSTDPKPTKETYGRFQLAFDVLNAQLFESELPDCLITLQRRKRSYGYFARNRFGRSDGRTTDEIALNPAHFRERPVIEVLATLTHEMVHLWQHHFGTPGRGRYHNREWADRMKVVGLQPTSTGEAGGRETGDSVHHLVVGDGRFARVVKRLEDGGFAIVWTEQVSLRSESRESSVPSGQSNKSGQRVRYTCVHEDCDLKAWAKSEASLICGLHMKVMRGTPE